MYKSIGIYVYDSNGNLIATCKHEDTAADIAYLFNQPTSDDSDFYESNEDTGRDNWRIDGRGE